MEIGHEELVVQGGGLRRDRVRAWVAHGVHTATDLVGQAPKKHNGPGQNEQQQHPGLRHPNGKKDPQQEQSTPVAPENKGNQDVIAKINDVTISNFLPSHCFVDGVIHQVMTGLMFKINQSATFCLYENIAFVDDIRRLY